MKTQRHTRAHTRYCLGLSWLNNNKVFIHTHAHTPAVDSLITAWRAVYYNSCAPTGASEPHTSHSCSISSNLSPKPHDTCPSCRPSPTTPTPSPIFLLALLLAAHASSPVKKILSSALLLLSSSPHALFSLPCMILSLLPLTTMLWLCLVFPFSFSFYLLTIISFPSLSSHSFPSIPLIHSLLIPIYISSYFLENENAGLHFIFYLQPAIDRRMDFQARLWGVQSPRDVCASFLSF